MSQYPGNYPQNQYPPPQNPQYPHPQQQQQQQQQPQYRPQYPATNQPQYGYPPQQQGQYPQYPQYPPPQPQYSQYPPPQQQQQPQYQQQQHYPPQQQQYPPPNYQQPATTTTSQYPPPQGGQYPSYTQQPPPQQLQQGWFGSFYNQISQNDMTYLQNWFSAIDTDRSGTVEVMELASMPFQGRTLGIEPAKKLIKAFDKNYSGKIDFYETAALYQFMQQMQNAFVTADKDRSGFLDSREIHHALQTGGFQVGLGTVQEICKKFDRGQGISLENFLLICAHLATVRSIFEWNDPQKTGKVTLNYDQLSHVSFHLMD